MLSKGVPFFLLMNIIIYDLSKSSLVHGVIKKPFVRVDFSNNTSKMYIPVEAEQLLLEIGNSGARQKRGIVLIDEDFDKLPDARVKQSWSGENTASDVTDVFKENEKDSTTDEGSGSTFEQESTTEFSITPGKLQIAKEKSKSTSLFETSMEGSGDDIPTTTEYLTTNQPEEEIVITDDSLLMCSNFTCDAHEIKISPGFVESLSEDSTLILTCSTMNFSSGDLLQWYKSNGSDNFQLEASIVKNQLQFAISKVKLEDSGKYLCISLTKQSCCHRQLDVTVYKRPNYKFHMLIVGLVIIVSLFVCLLLGIHRRYKIKKFKKQLKNQIPLNEFLL